MRQRPSFAFRALLSGAAVLLLALFSMIPSGNAPVTEARPALQLPTATFTTTPLPPDPNITPPEQLIITAGESGIFDITVRNNGDIDERFNFTISPGDVTVAGLTVAIQGPNNLVIPGN